MPLAEAPANRTGGLPKHWRRRTWRGSSIATWKPANIKVTPDGMVKVPISGLPRPVPLRGRFRASSLAGLTLDGTVKDMISAPPPT